MITEEQRKKNREYNKIYRERHYDKIKKRLKEWKDNNKEKVRKEHKEYYLKNREREINRNKITSKNRYLLNKSEMFKKSAIIKKKGRAELKNWYIRQLIACKNANIELIEVYRAYIMLKRFLTKRGK